jgi:molybdate transport system ATP-binding protein
VSGLAFSGGTRAGSLDLALDLGVEGGETVAVLGPNGAGKTTLLRAISGLLPLDRGSVVLDGRVLDEPASGTFVPPEDRSIGVVFQELLLFPALDVTDNVAFGLRARGTRREAARTDARRWLERVGLGDRASGSVATLSGGEAQRVALARALAAGPRALLLDEPLAALDADVRGTVRRDLRDHLRHHDGPRVLVTHDPLDAAVLADRVVVVEDGRITAAGQLEDLVAKPRSSWAAELAGTNLLRATARGAELDLATGGRLITADVVAPGPALVALRPTAIALHASHPAGSPRNVWEATVASVEGFGDRRRVRLAGAVPVVAEVTAASQEELGLVPGAAVWASAKATEVHAYPA